MNTISVIVCIALNCIRMGPELKSINHLIISYELQGSQLFNVSSGIYDL